MISVTLFFKHLKSYTPFYYMFMLRILSCNIYEINAPNGKVLIRPVKSFEEVQRTEKNSWFKPSLTQNVVFKNFARH